MPGAKEVPPQLLGTFVLLLGTWHQHYHHHCYKLQAPARNYKNEHESPTRSSHKKFIINLSWVCTVKQEIAFNQICQPQEILKEEQTEKKHTSSKVASDGFNAFEAFLTASIVNWHITTFLGIFIERTREHNVVKTAHNTERDDSVCTTEEMNQQHIFMNPSLLIY